MAINDPITYTINVMLKLTVVSLLAILLNSQCAPSDSSVAPLVPGQPSTPQSLTASGPAILEADAEGIGKATITDRTILVKLPAGYAKSTVRLTYTLTADVKKVTPASGQTIPVRSEQAPTVCIQNDALGNCTLSYQLIIQAASNLTVALDPASRQLDVTRYLQPYALTFQLGNLNAQTGVTRRFQVRFVNKATGYSYIGDNYMVNDKAGNVVFINQPNVTIPDEGLVRMTGTLPGDMPTGDYAISLLIPTCYSPGADGRCLLTGTEGVDLTESFVLRPGPPLVGETSPMPTAANEVLIKGRNFAVGKSLPVRLSNDFMAPADISATAGTETSAQLTLPASVSTGQYRLDVSPAGGQAYSALFTVPGANARPSFAYVAPVGSYVATQNALPTLPAFKGGEPLEIRYTNASPQLVKAVRLVDTQNAAHVIDLTGNGSFRPYAGVTDFLMWKWTLPVNLPKGVYLLTFESGDGVQSLPYYQAVRVN